MEAPTDGQIIAGLPPKSSGRVARFHAPEPIHNSDLRELTQIAWAVVGGPEAGLYEAQRWKCLYL
jgi:hypothetical protein